MPITIDRFEKFSPAPHGRRLHSRTRQPRPSPDATVPRGPRPASPQSQLSRLDLKEGSRAGKPTYRRQVGATCSGPCRPCRTRFGLSGDGRWRSAAISTTSRLPRRPRSSPGCRARRSTLAPGSPVRRPNAGDGFRLWNLARCCQQTSGSPGSSTAEGADRPCLRQPPPGQPRQPPRLPDPPCRGTVAVGRGGPHQPPQPARLRPRCGCCHFEP
jgi:hypothetical protein